MGEPARIVHLPVRGLGDLLIQLQARRAAEASAKRMRMDTEAKILEYVRDAPERGSLTLDGDGGMRCVVKYGVTYKVDTEALRHIEVPHDLPDDDFPLKQKWTFDAKAYEKLKRERPEVYRAIQKCVTVKPAKPNLTLKV